MQEQTGSAPVIVPAAPGTYIVYHGNDDSDWSNWGNLPNGADNPVEVIKTVSDVVIAWSIDQDGYPQPITKDGLVHCDPTLEAGAQNKPRYALIRPDGVIEDRGESYLNADHFYEAMLQRQRKMAEEA